MEEIDSVGLEPQALDTEYALIRQVLQTYGIDIDVRTEWPQGESGSTNGWFVLVTLAVPFLVFLRALATKLGEEAGQAVASLVRDLHSARRQPPSDGTVDFHDPTIWVTVAFGHDIPDKAFEQLWEVKWVQLRLGEVLVWDHETQQWMGMTQLWLRQHPGTRGPLPQGHEEAGENS